MKFGVNTYSMRFESDTEAKLRKAAEIGFDGLEFRPREFPVEGKLESAAADAEIIRETFAKCGVSPIAVACDADYIQTDPAKFEEFVRLGEYCAALSSKLGLRVVKYFAGDPKEGLDDDRMVQLMIDGSKKLAAFAEKYDVCFAEENHGMLTNRPEIQKRLIEGVGSKRVGVAIDSSNYRWFGHSLDTVHQIYREMAPYTYYLHIKDGDGSEGTVSKYKATALGEGELDLRLLFSELKKNGYNGDLVHEYEGPDGEAGVRRSLAYLKKLAHEVFII